MVANDWNRRAPAPKVDMGPCGLSEDEKARTAWIEKMTGMKGACLKCGGQKRVSTAAIKFPETYHDCELCGGTGYASPPFAEGSASKAFEWMIEPLGADGWQRFCYEYNSRLLSSTPPDPSSDRPGVEFASLVGTEIPADEMKAALAFEEFNSKEQTMCGWQKVHRELHVVACALRSAQAELDEERRAIMVETDRAKKAWLSEEAMRITLAAMRKDADDALNALATPAPAKSIDGLEDIIRVQKGEK
jgi:hypothetical protein